MQVCAETLVKKAYEEWMHDVGYDGKTFQSFKHNLSQPQVIQQQLQQVTMLHMVRSMHRNNYLQEKLAKLPQVLQVKTC
jgi:hypothetical protein